MWHVKTMSQPPPKLTTTESLKTEVARLLQNVIPVLDAVYTLPFYSQWLDQPLGKNYLQLMMQTEQWLLWFWQKLEQNNAMNLQLAVLSWEGGQKRTRDGLLQHYYRFYEVLGQWSQEHPDDFLRKEGWSGYIGAILNHEQHLLVEHLQGIASPQREELELIAQRYLRQMQLIHDLDPYFLCLDLFTLVGAFTRKSYFIPQLTFSKREENQKNSKLLSQEFFQKLKNTKQWSDLVPEYFELIGQSHSEK